MNTTLSKSRQTAGNLALGVILVGSVSTNLFYRSSVIRSSPLNSYLVVTYNAGETVSDPIQIETNSVSILSSNYSEITDEALWKQMDTLFGIWANSDNGDDDWLEELRGLSDNRMKAIYGDEWE